MLEAPGPVSDVSFRPAAAQREAGFEPDLIDAHYLFPDGVAATRAANQSGLPVCLTARGSDVTQIPAFRSPRRLIREARGPSGAAGSISS